MLKSLNLKKPNALNQHYMFYKFCLNTTYIFCIWDSMIASQVSAQPSTSGIHAWLHNAACLRGTMASLLGDESSNQNQLWALVHLNTIILEHLKYWSWTLSKQNQRGRNDLKVGSIYGLSLAFSRRNFKIQQNFSPTSRPATPNNSRPSHFSMPKLTDWAKSELSNTKHGSCICCAYPVCCCFCCGKPNFKGFFSPWLSGKWCVKETDRLGDGGRVLNGDLVCPPFAG